MPRSPLEIVSPSPLAPAPQALKQAIAGWGNFPIEECFVYRPERISELDEVVARAPERDLIPRGLGRSYGDASLNRESGVVLSHRFDRMLDFDDETGVLRCESSVSLAEVIEHFLPRGFFFPVTPGTKFISIGGAIAADVHGKNHHLSGSMSEHVLDFSLLTASGSVLRCSREDNPDAFWATMGGMGLTGFILDASIQLQRVETGYMNVQQEQAANLDVALERFFETDEDFGYAVAWIDCLSKGPSLGRSVLLRANHAQLTDLPARLRSSPCRPAPGRPLNVPFPLPSMVLNPFSMGIFNSVFYQAHRDERMLASCDSYFYTLDRIHHWNRVYGRRGVLQYQIALPPEHSREALVQILENLADSKRASFLAVLKTFGPGSQGLLSFPMKGHTLALDLPNTGPDLGDQLHTIDEIVLRAGGRVYLAKDACMRPEVFAQMYPGLDRFREIKAKLDPEQRFSSSQARRLQIVDPN
jgi:decaprenylphospho-beta-D-ribofuranose 2-oxidase